MYGVYTVAEMRHMLRALLDMENAQLDLSTITAVKSSENEVVLEFRFEVM